MTDQQPPARGAPDGEPTEHPAADLDRRFYAFFIDRLIAWAIYAVAAWAAYTYLIEPGQLWAGVGAIAGTVVLVGLLTSLGVGLAGVTVGNAVVGLRVVPDVGGRPIGVPRAILRTLILGVATLPTFGFGTAALAWTAVVDPSGRRRGWHDLRAHSAVVDVRPEPIVEVEEVEPPSPLVNLTAMRLGSRSAEPPRHAPVRRSRSLRTQAPAASEAAKTAPAPERSGLLGWPLVGAPPEATAAPATLGARTPAPAPAAPAAPPAPPVLPPSPAPAATPTPAAETPPPTPESPPAGAHRASKPTAAPAADPPSEPPVQEPPAAAAKPAEVEPAEVERAEVKPAEPTQPRGPATAPRARWRVSFDTGETFEVAGLTLIGRRPEARPGEPVKQLVALPSQDMSLSKTHAQFQVVPDGALVVMDRGSTNGTLLIRAGVSKRLTGGRPATLRNGDRVRFGDREMTVARLD